MMDASRSYIVPAAPADLLARLAKKIDPDGFFAELSFSDNPYYGTVGSGGFVIHRRTSYRNSFKLVLEGKVAPCPEGSLVRVRLRVNSFAPMFMKFWLVATMGFQFLFLLAFVAGEPNAPGWAVAAPAGMALFGLVMYRVGKWFSRFEGKHLLAFADELWGPPLPEEAPVEPRD